MKILHFADAHIGVETYGTVDAASGLSTRVIDVLDVLDRVVAYALDNNIDLVLFCGDAYRSRDPSQTHQREFAKRIRKLSDAGIPTVLVVGNHDLPSAVGRANSVEIFDTLNISNIIVAGKPGIQQVDTKSGEVQVVTFPWIRRSALLAREEARDMTIEQITERLQEIMTAKLMEMIAQIDPSMPAVFAGHVSVSTAKIGSETSMLIGRDPVLLLSNVANPAFDYVALGHIHRHQVLSEFPPVVYAGSLERLDFSDESEDKGFYTVDIELEAGKRMVTYQFHSVAARRFLTLEIEVQDSNPEPMKTIMDCLVGRQAEIKDAVVRLQLSLPINKENLIRDSEIVKALQEAYYVTIGKTFRRESRRIRSGDWASQGLTPDVALKKYLEIKNVSLDRQKVLMEYGEKLINQRLSKDLGDHEEQEESKN